MSASDDHIEESDEALAAEYVAGLLPAAERKAVHARVSTDREFAALVDEWEIRMSPLVAPVKEVRPPRTAWRRIERRALGAGKEAESEMERWLTFWRRFAVASFGFVAGAITVLQPGSEPPLFQSEPLIAAIRDTAGEHVLLARLDTGSGAIFVQPVPFGDAERRPQLWLLHDDDPPRPLGMLNTARPTRIVVPDSLRPLPDRRLSLGVTLEPAADAPAATPSGPMIARGKLVSI